MIIYQIINISHELQAGRDSKLRLIQERQNTRACADGINVLHVTKLRMPCMIRIQLIYFYM